MVICTTLYSTNGVYSRAYLKLGIAQWCKCYVHVRVCTVKMCNKCSKDFQEIKNCYKCLLLRNVNCVTGKKLNYNNLINLITFLE